MSLTIDSRSEASRPGAIQLDLRQYLRFFPLVPSCLLVFLVGSATLSFLRPVPGGIMGGLITTIAWIYFRHIQAHFARGCLNPAVVLRAKPLMLAVYSDLSSDRESSYPAIKVIEHPAPSPAGFATGERCLAVSLYSGSRAAKRWEDFFPKLAESATRNSQAIRAARGRIPEKEWRFLEESVVSLPKPWKSGVYPVRDQSRSRPA